MQLTIVKCVLQYLFVLRGLFCDNSDYFHTSLLLKMMVENQHSELWDQNGPKARNKTTAQRLAEKYNVSQMSIKRDTNLKLFPLAIAIGYL